MKPNTKVALALKHVGRSDESIQCWTGTSAEVILEFAKYLGRTYMATRFDLVMARTEEEARRGLTLGRRDTSIPVELTLENLERMMEQSNSPTAEVIHHVPEHDPNNPKCECSTCWENMECR